MPPDALDDRRMEPPVSPTKHQTTEENGNANSTTTTTTTDTAAAELIHTLDTAFAEMSSFAATAARDAEVARKNARAAAEIARLYRTTSSDGDGDGEIMNHKIGDHNQNSNGGGVVDNDELWDEDELEALNNDDGFSPLSSKQHTYENGDDVHAVQPPPPPNHGDPENSRVSQSQPPSPPPPPPSSSTPHRNPEYENKDDGDTSTTRYRSTHPKTPSSVERLANSHAEDVLSLSLELERTKQALQRERDAHKDTQLELTTQKALNGQSTLQIQSLEKELQIWKQDDAQKMESLSQELQQSKMRVEAAEEDAELALEMAKENSESREQMEEWLQRSLQEVQLLREQLLVLDPAAAATAAGGDSSGAGARENNNTEERNGMETSASDVLAEDDEKPPKRKSVVRFADEMQPPTDDQKVAAEEFELEFDLDTETQQASSSDRHSSKSMVAAGRSLLQRSRPIAEENNDMDDPVHVINFTPETSTERRERLSQRLRELGGGEEMNDDLQDENAPSPSAFSIHHTPSSLSSSPYHHKDHHHHTHGVEIGYASKAIESCKTISNLLKESGKRLDLGGHYFRTPTSLTGTITPRKGTPGTTPKKDDGSNQNVNVEALARQYCNSVEVKFDRQNGELKELESLCDYLERKLAETDETNFGDLSSSP